jgi:hypothetical protein
MKIRDLGAEEQLRAIDWSLRENALEATNIDPRTRYTLVTYGLVGPNEHDAKKLDHVSGSAGKLALFTGKEGGTSYIGHVENVEFVVESDNFCFMHIPDDVIASTTWLNMVIPNLSRFVATEHSYDINDKSWTWKSRVNDSLNDYPADEPLKRGIRLFEKYGILPYVTEYDENNQPVFDFSKPIGCYDETNQFGTIFSRLKKPQLLVGEDVEVWFKAHIVNGTEQLEHYKLQLDEMRHVFS